jgi:hypothetical protein
MADRKVGVLMVENGVEIPRIEIIQGSLIIPLPRTVHDR